MEAWERLSGNNGFSTANRLAFYMLYLQEVVPYDVGVFHVPANAQAHDLNEGLNSWTSRREEIQLRHAEFIFMTGLLSMEQECDLIEPVAAALTYEHWRSGWMVPDPRQAWGMFTCLQSIRFYISRNGRGYDNVNTLRPIQDVREVVRYIRHEFERIRRR